jgi:Fe-S oxidoreductase
MKETLRAVNNKKFQKILDQKKERMKFLLSFCAHCGLCAESCPLYRNYRKPEYIPAYKAINSLGKIYKKKNNIDLKLLEEIKELIWKNCVLCGRCYCPLGIDIPGMIALARSICRSYGIYGVYPHSLGEPL